MSVIASGLALGFGGGLLLLSVGEYTTGKLDITANLRAEAAWIAQVGKGWGSPTLQGTPITEAVATLSIPLAHMPQGDIVVDIERAAVPARSSGEIEIRINDVTSGTWPVASVSIKRLLLSREIAARSKALSLTLIKHNTTAPIVINQVKIKDVSALTDILGTINDCSDGRLTGWAKADDAPAPLKVRRGGTTVMSVLPSVERPDLPPFGHPIDAGFFILLTPPPNTDETIELVLPNGTALATRCKS